MLHTRYTFGALVVVLDTATGRVDAILHKLTDPMRNASELFSQTYIDAAVRAASLAWGFKGATPGHPCPGFPLHPL